MATNGAWPGTTRRQVLKGALGTGAATLLGGALLNACGGTAGQDGSSTTRAPVRGGTLTVGSLGGGSGESIDAYYGPNPIDFLRQGALYDKTLVFSRDMQSLENELAEEVSFNDALDTFTVRLRDGVEFHHGKTLGADDLEFTLRRLGSDESSASEVFKSIDPNGFRKLDDRTLEFKLAGGGNYLMYELLASYRGGIVPVDYDPANPVGTGAFKFVSWTPGEQSVMTRNENYWRTDVLIDELVIQSFDDATALFNAFQSGQLDVLSGPSATQAKTLESNPDVSVYRGLVSSWSPIVMNTQAPPFDDVRVRTAMRLIANRQQLIDQALGGEGEVMNDIPLHYDPFGYPDVPQREQDIDEAKSLLRSAGQEDLQVELVVANLLDFTVPAAQVYAEQARAAGVDVRVTVLDSGEFYGDAFGQRPFTTDYWAAQTYLMQAASFLLPDAFYNETQYNDPEWIQVVTEAMRTPDADARGELLLRAQEIDYERGGYINWGAQEGIEAMVSNVAGYGDEPLNSYTSMNDGDFYSLHFTE